MTGQDLIQAYCDFFGISRAEFALLGESRHEKMNREFWRFFEGKEITEENLVAFYTESETTPLGILHSALGQIRSGQAFWIQQKVRVLEIGNILDYGCGFASAAGPLSEEMPVCLADIPGRHLEMLRKLYPKAGVLALDEILPAKFDAVICQEVFEHTLNPFETAKKVLSHVAEGGVAFLSWTFGGFLGNQTHLQSNDRYFKNDLFRRELEGLGWVEVGKFDPYLGMWKAQ